MPSLRFLSGLAAAALAAVTIGSGRAAAQTDALYRLGPDSEPQSGVPQGTVTEWEKLPSQAYPGTLHDFCVYVPAQYDPATPAALMIFQDGQAWLRLTGDYRVPYVFDNLIYRREMPVTIAVFINPGRTAEQPEASAADWGDRSTNRPQEYNALDDKYARVITDELMPMMYKRYNLSRDPGDHAIGGASSGAIAAFTVAWHRPDQFRKVLSTIGSFTNIRGGHVYPDLIRASDRKPIRIFLQDGFDAVGHHHLSKALSDGLFRGVTEESREFAIDPQNSRVLEACQDSRVGRLFEKLIQMNLLTRRAIVFALHPRGRGELIIRLDHMYTVVRD